MGLLLIGMAQTKIKELSSDIVIDREQGLVFRAEKELYEYFSKEIESLEKEFLSCKKEADIPLSEFDNYENHLDLLLDSPDQVWEDKETIPGRTLTIFLREIDDQGEGLEGGDQSRSPEEGRYLFHVAVTHCVNRVAMFVYLHFPTTDISLIEEYQRGEVVFDRIMSEAPVGAIDGDALVEGDELAIGLFESMMKLRGEDDIEDTKFGDFGKYREMTIEDGDEIWRRSDSLGNVLVSFIKEISSYVQLEHLFYVVVTIEDANSGSHALLFSFPSTDSHLVDRYRQGERLQAEEVIQEPSH